MAKKTAAKKTASRKSMPVLSAGDILDAEDFQVEQVEVPEWGGVVCVRTLSEGNYIDWIHRSRQEDVDASVDLFVRSVCEPNGDLMFSEEEVEALRGKSIGAMNRVVNAIMELNGLKIRDEEELVGKLESQPSGSHTG